MTSAIVRNIAATALLVIVTSSAQAQLPERPCRIVFDDQSWGPVDPWKTHGEIRLGPRMMQSDGSFMMMGQGTVTVTFETNFRDGCTITAGAEQAHQAQAIVTSTRDGTTGEVDLIMMDNSHEITFACRGTPGEGKLDKGVILPPPVTIKLIHGATANYEDADPGNRTGNRGVMKIEYCRADPQ